MAHYGEVPVLSVTFEAGASFGRYTPVTQDAQGRVVPAAAGSAILGIAQDEATLGHAVAVMVLGISFAKLSAAVTPGVSLAVTADGTFGPAADAATASGARSIQNGAAGEVQGVLLK